MQTLLILTVLLTSGWAHGAALCAALKPAPSTLGSEIRRGADAAFGCQIDNSARPLDSEAFLQCLHDQQRTNRQHLGRSYEAFDTGLWFTARERLRGVVSVAPSDLAKSNLNVVSEGLTEAERAQGMTDNDVWRMLHPCR